MKKIARIDLVGVPWPVNLLKCYRHTGEMQPGEKKVISVADQDIKNNLLLILNTMPELSVDVSAKGHCFDITVTKARPRICAKDCDFTGKD